ncbi:MAG: glycosyltransferase family 4 protein [Calditrichaeota bacterium]|nr:glycosyltransferase family 4 protein [Calditrichota bacterium]
MKHFAPNTSPAFTAGIDCLALPEKFSGAAYYIHHLTRNLLETERRFAVVIFCKPRHRHLYQPFLKPGDRVVTPSFKTRAGRILYYEYGLSRRLRREGVDLFLATHYLCPPRHPAYRIVNTFHDLGFVEHPRYYGWIRRFYFGRRYRTFLERADLIFAVSHLTRRSLERRFGERVPPVEVVYPGTDHLADGEPGNGKLNGVSKPVMLAVNTFEKRKNIPEIIRLFRYLKEVHRFPHQLWLVGQRANGWPEIRRAIAASPVGADIVLKEHLSTADLVRCYRQAELFVNMSAYEGFGFTPMEAINHNLPAFLFRNAVLDELLPENPYIFSHLEIEAWGDQIARARVNQYRERLSPDCISQLNWQRSAGKAAALLEALWSGNLQKRSRVPSDIAL